jgi:CRISPR-associated endonuclease/helicase Cas3
MAGLAGKVVILDEVHAYDTYMSTVVERMLQWLAALGTSVVLLSATLPTARRQALAQAYGLPLDGDSQDDSAYPLVLAGGTHGRCRLTPTAYQPERTLALGVLHFESEESEAKARWLLSQVHGGGCACWIANTVREAQDIFEHVQRLSGTDVDCQLIHARFPVEDRQHKEQALVQRYGPTSVRPPRGIVVGTQVLEQSLDLDFDVMVSDLAPVDLLLQRAGRLHRHLRSERPQDHTTPRLWVQTMLDPGGEPHIGRGAIYEPYILLRSWQVLRERALLTLPADYRILVEAVYSPEPPAQQDPLYPLWVRLQSGITRQRDEALLRLAGAPDADTPFCHGASITYHEDEDSAAWIVAQTRLGEESITVIPLVRAGEQARIIPLADVVQIDAPADRAMQLRLLRRSMRVSNYVVVHALKPSAEFRPQLFAASPLLKHCFPLWLDEQGSATLVHGQQEVQVTFDPTLGLRISRSNAHA